MAPMEVTVQPSRAMLPISASDAGSRKMPEPIILPVTNIVSGMRDSFFGSIVHLYAMEMQLAQALQPFSCSGRKLHFPLMVV